MTIDFETVRVTGVIDRVIGDRAALGAVATMAVGRVRGERTALGAVALVAAGRVIGERTALAAVALVAEGRVVVCLAAFLARVCLVFWIGTGERHYRGIWDKPRCAKKTFH